MKKYDIDFKNLSMLNFEELYAAIMKKIKCTEFKHNLTKTMRENAFKKLNCWKKLFMKNNAVIICADDMFLSCQQSEFMKKLKLKTVLNTIIQNQLDNLNLKAEIFWLNILSLSESFE